MLPKRAMAQFGDIVLAGIALGMPAYFVLRSKRFGILLGAAALWLLVFLCGEVSYAWAGSPLQEHRGLAVEEWLMGGWVTGLLYCSLLWFLNEGFQMGRRGLSLYHEQIRSGLGAARSFDRVWRALNETEKSAVRSPSHRLLRTG